MEGSGLVHVEWDLLKTRLQELKELFDLDGKMSTAQNDAAYLRFFALSSGGFYQDGYNALTLRFDLVDLADNSMAGAKLISQVRLEFKDSYSQRYQPRIVTGSESEFVPKFDEYENVIWERGISNFALTVMVADECFEKFQRFLDQRLGGQALSWYSRPL